MSTKDGPITVPQFVAMKAAGQKISMLTAYDFTMARLLDAAGIEGILVGDSLSMVVQGHPTTLAVTLDQMIYHAEMVGRAVEHALVVVDLPFPSVPPRPLQGRGVSRPHSERDSLPGREAGGRRRAGRNDLGHGIGRHSGDGALRAAAAKRPRPGRL